MSKLSKVSVVLICTLLVLMGLPSVQAQGKYKQAPILDAKVTSGELPAVDQRLPKNPLVVPTLEIGKYGGTWHLATKGAGDDPILIRTVGYHNLVRWNVAWTEIIPDIAEAFESNAEGTVFTFHLREGMKWSDGEPFTADDVLFAVNDNYLNSEVYAAPPVWLTSGGKPVVATKTDDYTLVFTFAAPNGMFLQQLATPNAEHLTAQPKHYLSQFHKTYADPAKLDAALKEAGVESWLDLYNQKGGSVGGKSNPLWFNADLPTVYPYHVVSPLAAAATQIKLERNPYFYGVDSEGQQLPYIDTMEYNVYQDVQAMVLKALNGEIDVQDRHIATNANKSVFFENQEKGGYHFYSLVPSSMNVMVISLNLTNLDLQKRAIYQNKDFRIGLSQAINRQELIDVVWVGQGKPSQVGPRPESQFYDEELSTQYTGYDVDAANAALDKVLPNKDSEGFRLLPDGTRLVLSIEVINGLQPEWPPALELIQKYWEAVGVKAEVVAEERTLYYTRKDANQLDVGIWGGDGGLEVTLEPRYYFPYSAESTFAEAWQYWFNNPKDERAEEPPAAVKKQQDLYRTLLATADLDQQNELMKQILQITKEEFYTIGISLTPNGYGIVKNNVGNVPDTILNAYLYPSPAPVNTFTFFFKN